MFMRKKNLDKFNDPLYNLDEVDLVGVMLFDVFSQNGQIRPADEAVVSLENLEYTYGFGVYETMKIRQGVLYFSELHVDRLLNSARIIGLQHVFTQSSIHQSLLEFAEYLQSREPELSCNLKILLIGATEPQKATLSILPLAPLFPDRRLYKQGVITGTVEYERWRPQAKSLNMLPSYVYYTQGKQKGWYDTLLVNHRGEITEGTRTNFYAIQGTTVFTPPAEEVLQGVTYLTLKRVMQTNGLDLVERPISRNSLSEFEGAFLTSTSTKIVPVKQVDGFVYSQISPEIKRLMKLYDQFLAESGGRFEG
jgi:branched-subunit amino acid aminotransferase/4-amino-4-deoxychorismate lyase